VLYSFTREGAAVHFAGAAFMLACLLTLVSLVPFMRGVAINRKIIASTAK
jgi:DHA1 family tetracycline resistance protein-like MFS transporter